MGFPWPDASRSCHGTPPGIQPHELRRALAWAQQKRRDVVIGYGVISHAYQQTNLKNGANPTCGVQFVTKIGCSIFSAGRLWVVLDAIDLQLPEQTTRPASVQWNADAGVLGIQTNQTFCPHLGQSPTKKMPPPCKFGDFHSKSIFLFPAWDWNQMFQTTML